MKTKVIKGRLDEIEKKKAEKQQAIEIAYLRMLEKYEQASWEDIGLSDDERMRFIYLSIRYITSQNVKDYKAHYEEYMTMFTIVENLLIGMPSDAFVRWFPITKRYDGERYGMKDYFYAKSIVQQTPILLEPLEFMMEYSNPLVDRFMIIFMHTVSAAMAADGQEDPMLTFLKEKGVTTYHQTDLPDGKILMTGSDGSQQIVKRKLPNPMKLRVVGVKSE